MRVEEEEPAVMFATYCTPVDGSLTISDAATANATCTVLIDPAELVFQGHYPGLPIFPGACLVEYVHRGALATAPKSLLPLELAAIESARFLRPVWPADELRIELTGRGQATTWRCSAQAVTPRGTAAQIELRYRGRADR